MFRPLECEYHAFRYLTSWSDLEVVVDGASFDVALVDSAPADARVPSVLTLKGKVAYIICHDAEPREEHWYGYSRVIPQFRYCYRYALKGVGHNDGFAMPETIVLSDHAPFEMP